jgi:hypothetical protein
MIEINVYWNGEKLFDPVILEEWVLQREDLIRDEINNDYGECWDHCSIEINGGVYIVTRLADD